MRLAESSKKAKYSTASPGLKTKARSVPCRRCSVRRAPGRLRSRIGNPQIAAKKSQHRPERHRCRRSREEPDIDMACRLVAENLLLFLPQEHRNGSQDRRHRRRVGPGRTGRRIPCLQDALHVDIRPLGPGLAVRGPHCQHPEVARRARCGRVPHTEHEEPIPVELCGTSPLHALGSSPEPHPVVRRGLPHVLL